VKGEFMGATNASDQTPWKQFFRDAVLELDPRVFDQRLEAAKKAIEDRLLELIRHDSTDPGELAQLADAQRTVSFLQKTEHKNMR
jgi:multidrug resistance efflux pump